MEILCFAHMGFNVLQTSFLCSHTESRLVMGVVQGQEQQEGMPKHLKVVVAAVKKIKIYENSLWS